MKVPVVPGVKLIPKSLRQDLTNTSELIKPTQTEYTARYDRSVTDVTGPLIILPYNLQKRSAVRAIREYGSAEPV